MIAEVDTSGDGRVDYSEFAHVWKTYLLQKQLKPVTGRIHQVISIYPYVLYVVQRGLFCTAGKLLIIYVTMDWVGPLRQHWLYPCAQ